METSFPADVQAALDVLSRAIDDADPAPALVPRLVAGRAVITLESPRNTHLTYRLKGWSSKKWQDARGAEIFFLGLKDVERRHASTRYGWANVGRIKPFYAQDPENLEVAYRLLLDARGVQDPAVIYGARLIEGVLQGEDLELAKGGPYGLSFSSNCARCGRALTTPESIADGIGPECIKYLRIKPAPASRLQQWEN